MVQALSQKIVAKFNLLNLKGTCQELILFGERGEGRCTNVPLPEIRLTQKNVCIETVSKFILLTKGFEIG